ncbi:MAG: S8 family serine peptidase [Bacteroidales bacterium]|nr:S8 family serine peptidase [Bacteroidales bacterium]
MKVLFSEEMIGLIEEDLSRGQLRTRSEGLNDLTSELGVESMERLFPFAREYEPRTRKEGLHRWYKVRYAQDVPVTRATRAFEALPGVEQVEVPIKASLATNDRNWGDQWALNNVRFPGYDINAQLVWENYTAGNPDVIVAVVDGGIDLTHPDLAWNCLSSGHKNYVRGADGIVGHDHGTHVAGTIAAVSNNGIGIAGVAGGDYARGKRGVSLLSQQCFYTVGSGQNASDRSGDFETALKEAADKGALIASNSWGYNFDENDDGQITGSELASARSAHENVQYYSIARAIDYFVKYAGCDNDGNQLPGSLMKGGLVVFAAGNENIPYGAPSNYEPCIAVGATTMNGSKASFSNYGDWVDICAPGSSIISTYPGGSFVSFSGTSMACPHVSGVAALIVSFFGGQGFTVDQLKSRLLEGARDIGLSTGARPIGSFVDAYGSFVAGDSRVPDPVTDFTVVPMGHNVRFVFDGGGGAYGYMALAARSEEALLKTSLTQLDGGIEASHLIIADSEAPVEPRTITMLSLEPDTDYYVSVVAYSYGRRYSDLAPIRKIHTGTNGKPVISTEEGVSFVFRQYESVDIPFTLTDPDMDTLRVDFQTNGRATLREEEDGRWHFHLACQAVRAPASFQATVVVTDRYGAQALRSFNYSVLENVAPVLSDPFAPVLLTGAGEQADVALPPHFLDEDGEPLDFRVNSLNTTLLSAELVDGQTLRITAKDLGLGSVRVSASDAMGESVRGDVSVLVRPSGEQVTVLEGASFSDKLTVLGADTPAPTLLRLVGTSGVIAAEVRGNYSAFEPIVLDTRGLSPGLYTLYVDIAGSVTRRTLVKK